MDRNVCVRSVLACLMYLTVGLLASVTEGVAPPKTAPANYLVNDTAPGIAYSGASWSYSTGRHNGDYLDDVHYCTTNGQYAQYTFTGTGIGYVSETYSDEGNVRIYIDGVYQTTVNAASANRTAQPEFST